MFTEADGVITQEQKSAFATIFQTYYQNISKKVLEVHKVLFFRIIKEFNSKEKEKWMVSKI